ncbi:mitochondrial import inner membrane translocase subunit TIM16 [Ceratocystis pirilliformis]|uniref:Mitochondrial import inner membrane translocase subunit TIM16 n=1 Tax=Ceratocystis pirilliformis TaxID=259994 RepID=A0ABR3ZBX0_9PEZI
MAHRMITQAVIVGSRILGRSFMAAYKQAQASSQYSRSQAKLNPNGAGGGRAALASGMTLDEACLILNVPAPNKGAVNSEEVVERFKRLFDANDPKKGGSFYLQSKVVRAKERMEAEIGPLVEKLETEAEAQEGFKPKIYKDR